MSLQGLYTNLIGVISIQNKRNYYMHTNYISLCINLCILRDSNKIINANIEDAIVCTALVPPTEANISRINNTFFFFFFK